MEFLRSLRRRPRATPKEDPKPLAKGPTGHLEKNSDGSESKKNKGPVGLGRMMRRWRGLKAVGRGRQNRSRKTGDQAAIMTDAQDVVVDEDHRERAAQVAEVPSAAGELSDETSCPAASSSLLSPTAPEGAVAPSAVKDGNYFIKVMDEENARIEALIGKAEADLVTGTVPDEACGCLRAAIGKGRLLLGQKFLQFRTLCENNLKPGEGEERVLPEDLAGFWDLVNIQVDEIRRTFQELAALKEGGWQPRDENAAHKLDPLHEDHCDNKETELLLGKAKSSAVAVARKTKSSDVTPRKSSSKRPSLPSVSGSDGVDSRSSSAAKKSSDEERRKKLAEFKQKMKRQREVEAAKTEDGGALSAGIVVFDGVDCSDKQRLRA